MQSMSLKIKIDHLNELFLSMSIKVKEALEKSRFALRQGDKEMVKLIKEEDAEIDRLQQAIDDEVAQTMATQQPVASDLRLLVSLLKIASDFERAGDYAVHLAKAGKHFVNMPVWKQFDILDAMAQQCGAMIDGTARAFIERDSIHARSIAKMDDEIDHAHKAVVKDTLLLIHQNPELAEQAAKIITLSGYLERLGDHMTNACEAIVFMVEGIHTELND